MVLETRLYDILLVPATASTEEISRAYKKIALKCHPDKTGRDPELTEKFKDVTRAYEMLKDAETRRVYDHHGEAGVEGHALAATAPPNAPTPMRHATNIFLQVFSDFHQAFNGGGGGGGAFPMNMHMNMMNMMDPMAGAAFASFGGQPPVTRVEPAATAPAKPLRGHDIHHVCSVTLAELYFGKVVKLRLPHNSQCSTCHGVGGTNPLMCKRCAGLGQVVVTTVGAHTQMRQVKSCRECSGTGVYILPRDRCPAGCQRGYIKENKIIRANVFPGLKHGDKIILQGVGDEGRNIVPGDVVIHLQEVPHASIVRRGNDLYLEQDVDLKTALCGGKVVVHDFVRAGQDLEVCVNVHGHQALNSAEVDAAEVVGVIGNGTPKIVKHYGMPINEASIEGTFFQNSDEVEEFGDVIFDLNRYRRGDLFIKFNVVMPEVHFSEGDVRDLERILPPSMGGAANADHMTGQLSNIPLLAVPCAKRMKKSYQDYDYNDIEASEEDEEREDEEFYASEWDDKKRKSRIDGMKDYVTT